MRIGLLTAWANRANGGVFEAVATHAAMLAELGFTPHVFALAHPDDERDSVRLEGIEVTRVPVLGPKIVGFGKGLTRRLIEARLDVLHLHGIWTHVSADGAGWARATGRPYIISPHGMFDDWTVNRGKVKKTVARAWFERRNWKAATVFHALTGQEAANTTSVTGCRNIEIIPNGIAIPEQCSQPGNPPTMVCIARIHAVKNLVSLVEGWRIARAGEQGWRLVLAGWGADADVARLKAALGEAPESDGISFVGPVYGEAKDRLLAQASFVVLPSLSEALPMGILEAWAAGVPSLMSNVIPLPEGFTSGAAIGMGTAPAEIAEGLREVISLNGPAREAMATAARSLAIEHFSTQAIADRWTSLYRSLAD
ncbi:MAG: glycosyltransferase [Novosphingobium sp.]|nr:glycosyltransferase [Novosphingobium sp.]